MTDAHRRTIQRQPTRTRDVKDGMGFPVKRNEFCSPVFCSQPD